MSFISLHKKAVYIYIYIYIYIYYLIISDPVAVAARSFRKSAAAPLQRILVWIPPEECCVLSGRGLCEELITPPEESYRTVLRRCVWSRKLVNEEALAHRRGGGGLSRQKLTIVSEIYWSNLRYCRRASGSCAENLHNYVCQQDLFFHGSVSSCFVLLRWLRVSR